MSNSKAVLVTIGAVIWLTGCAMTPEQKAYRQRLELGVVAPQEVRRFRTPEQAQLRLSAAASDMLPVYARPLDRELIEAAGRGDSARIKQLLTAGAHANAIDEWRNTPLLSAAREGQVESARLLLDAGAEVDGRGGAMPPLAAAALRGHAIMVRLLLRHGARVDAPGANGLTALMNAVKLNQPEVARVLLEGGADTRVRDRDGQTLLGVAVHANFPEMLSLLVAHGVDPNIRDRSGLTALYWAQYLQRPELVAILQNAGADAERTEVKTVESRPYRFGEF